MTVQFVTDIVKNAFLTIIEIVGPILLVAIIIGLIVSIIQATTQIQEQTLTFAPKLFGIFLVIILMAPFIFDLMINFTFEIFEHIKDFS